MTTSRRAAKRRHASRARVLLKRIERMEQVAAAAHGKPGYPLVRALVDVHVMFARAAIERP